MYMLIYNDVDTGEQIVMDESVVYRDMIKELNRLIREYDYCPWALHIINSLGMTENPYSKDRAYKGFIIRQGTGV